MIISSATLYAFIAGLLLSLIWCLVLLAGSMWIQSPNSSFYPEIDFGSKCVSDIGSIGRLLYPMSNADTSTIRTELRDTRFFVGVREEADERRHIELNIDGRTGGLSPGSLYR